MEGQFATPSARLIAAAEGMQEVADRRGRRLSLRRLGALDKLRLFKAAGTADRTDISPKNSSAPSFRTASRSSMSPRP